MQRDGELQSLWQSAADSFTPKQPAEEHKTFDVIIIGGGITGLTTALLLQANGKKCLLVEAHNIGFGTTGGSTAHLNTVLDTPYSTIEENFSADAAQLMCNGAKEAIHLVDLVTMKYDIQCDFVYKVAVTYAETDKEQTILDDIYDSALRAGVVGQPVTELQIPSGFKRAYKFEGQGQLHPLKYILGLAKAFEDCGGLIMQHCFVSGVDTSGHAKIVHTSAGDMAAENVVYATHLPPGINVFSVRCAPYRSYAMAFTLNSGDYPTQLIYDSQDPYHYFRTHEVDGQKYVIGGGYDHKTGHHANPEHIFAELEAYVRGLFDVKEVVSKWSSQYYESADGLPFIGLMPGEDHVYVATGFGGNGITLGSLAGKIISDLLLNGHSPYADLLSPSRIKPIAGLANFIRENADVVSMFVGKRLSYEHISELAELANGEAKVVEYNGAHLALYKDDMGRIFALDPVCPHARCIVVWNNAEKSWDCPCHGARYAPDGKLLTGPAKHGLTRIDWSHL